MANDNTLTGANAVITFQIPGLFDTPVQLQGWAADNVFDAGAIASAEGLMGVDGFFSGGFVFVEIPQNYHLQADSESIAFFDQWWATQQSIQDVLFANATIIIAGVHKKWTMSRGLLTGYTPIPAIKKLLQPQDFGVTWGRISPSPA